MDARTDDQATAAALLVRIHARDRDALKSLYLLFGRRLHSYAFQILRDEHAAQDVVHDVFLRVWRYAGTYDPARSAKPEAWLFQVARNVAITEAASRARMQQLEQEDGEDEACEAAPPDPRHPQREACGPGGDALAQAMRSLPGPCRQVMHLRFHLDMSNPEIARHLGIPVGTAKTWLRRGLIHMREQLGVAELPARAQREEIA